MNIYIGNLAKEITEDDLKEAFEAFGQVASAVVIKEKFSGESRGFGFVEMPSKKEAEEAINGLKELKGRMVTINEARPRPTDNRGRGGSGGGRGGPRDRDRRSGGMGMGNRRPKW